MSNCLKGHRPRDASGPIVTSCETSCFLSPSGCVGWWKSHCRNIKSPRCSLIYTLIPIESLPYSLSISPSHGLCSFPKLNIECHWIPKYQYFINFAWYFWCHFHNCPQNGISSQATSFQVQGLQLLQRWKPGVVSGVGPWDPEIGCAKTPGTCYILLCNIGDHRGKWWKMTYFVQILDFKQEFERNGRSVGK